MFRLIVTAAFLALTSYANADCKTDNSRLGASYKITTKGANGVSAYNFILWRNGKQVAHEYTDRQITEIWEQLSNGLLRMNRYFDDHARAIEYEPLEINRGKGERDWGLKYQLISNALISRMQLIRSNGIGCDAVERYEADEKGVEIRLEWLPQQKLVRRYVEVSASGKTAWALQNIMREPARVQQAFIARDHYQTTDYADIGDNESDPFLLKMINLGHIEHSVSGFYTADGLPLVKLPGIHN